MLNAAETRNLKLTLKHPLRLFLVVATLLTVVGCSGPTVKTQPPTFADTVRQQERNINALLAEAQMSQSPQREALLMQAAAELYQQSKLQWARNLLTSIDPSLLNNSLFIEYTLLFSEIALSDDAYFLAQRILTNPRLDQQWQSLSQPQEVLLRQRRADLFMILGEPEISINERLKLQGLLSGDNEANLSNQDNLWQSLMAMPVTTLEEQSKLARDNELSGWYRLALISKNNQSNLDQQLLQVNRWVATWPQHPASFRLPKDLQLLQRLVQNRPKQVALLLPQEGHLALAGKAIRDGFIAAYYQARTEQAATPRLRIYDSSEDSISSLYQRAMLDGADMIIGPLDKDKVVQLNQLEELPIPVLAVNYTDDNSTSHSNLYQLGLAAEDEARQTAQKAWIEGHRYAMILNTNANWGKRSADAFRQAWEAKGGHIIDQTEFKEGENFAKVIGQSLLIDQSQQRAKALQGLFGQTLETEPRRRQDADMLFLVAKPAEARQINPTLAFHYASDLPVFATSQIYSGSSDRKSDRDLNDIVFSNLPWFFDNDTPEKITINKSIDPTPAYQRLYALGVDSYHLYPRLKQLEQTQQTRFFGATGVLHMTPDRKIEREQVWAKVVNGEARPLTTLNSQR